MLTQRLVVELEAAVDEGLAELEAPRELRAAMLNRRPRVVLGVARFEVGDQHRVRGGGLGLEIPCEP